MWTDLHKITEGPHSILFVCLSVIMDLSGLSWEPGRLSFNRNTILNIPILPEAFLTFASKSSVSPSHRVNVHSILQSLEYAVCILTQRRKLFPQI